MGLDGDIPSVWEFVKFKDYLQLISGRDLKSTEYKDNLSGASLYITGASNFQNGTIVTYRTTDCPSVISLKGDLLITVKGTIGEMAYNSFEEAHIARQIMAIRPYSSSENLEFVRLFLTSEISKIQAKAQSMIPGISRDVLLSLIVPLPPLQEQSKIVKRVSELSSLIEQFSVQFLLAR